MNKFFFSVIAISILSIGIAASKHHAAVHQPKQKKYSTGIICGADQTGLYFNYLKGRNVGMLVNQTSIIGDRKTPLVDSLLKRGANIKKIFGPEHGIRGNASNGALVNDAVDEKTGLPAISLYGKHYKPTIADLAGIDLMIFDVQDVGVRFYTYISTLHYIMEACAENNVELLILDRPNPNGYLVDGPILDSAYRSFVGMHPIPIAHGMTIGEYAQMINGEGWLKNHVQCKLKIIKVANYKHSLPYVLPVSPSPNLNTAKSILLYPSTCLFEGTSFSLGRGTMYPFTLLGHPLLKDKYAFSFTPVSIAGMSEDPPQKNQVCYGIDLRNYDTDQLKASGQLNLDWLIKFYREFPDKDHFFIAYFNKLAGTDQLRKQIEAGKTEAEIRGSWQAGLNAYKTIRKKYLLYP